jgi:lipoprotein signal peptidase/GNAT superfamily N-acetyltransferase
MIRILLARWSAPLALAIVVVATIGCDRVTKRLATETLAGTPGRSYLSDTIRLHYAENTGGFLSLGADLPPAVRTVVFTIGTGLMTVGLVIAAFWFRYRGWMMVGVVLFAAGSASNWVDRAMHGAVVDFLNVGIGPLRTGIFNVADVAIMAGAALVMMGASFASGTAPRVVRASIADERAQALIGALNAELTATYPEPGANHFSLDADELAPGRGAFLLIEDAGAAVACGAVRLIAPGTAELKRMFVAPSARGRGLGRMLVTSLESEARQLGAQRLVLETGRRQLAAMALYERTGFREIPLYGGYNASPGTSVCMGKDL